MKPLSTSSKKRHEYHRKPQRFARFDGSLTHHKARPQGLAHAKGDDPMELQAGRERALAMGAKA